VTGTVMRTALRKSLAQIQYVHPVGPAAADGLVAEVYRQLEDEFGMIAPPMALHSPAPAVLAASWLMLRETLLTAGRLSRAAKEAVAAAVSVANTCPYCVEVHGTTMRSLGARSDAEAIAADRLSEIVDPSLSRIATWARTSGYRDQVTVPPVPAEQVPEVVGVATVFQYLNRMVHIFLGDSPMPPGTPDAAKGAARWVLAKVLRSSASIGRTPGTALDLLPAAAPVPGFEWASASPAIAAAFARAWHAVDDTAVPAPVRALVLDRLATWTGLPAGPSRSWVDGAVAGLPADQRPAGRLALLTAVAAYQVDAQVIADVQADDATLIALTSWSSLAAARHISTWIPAAAQAA
jgi:AhpD family alkylhydroperoxidase